MDAQAKLTQLKMVLNEVADLRHALALASWDQQCYMPVGGSRDRGNMMASLSRVSHIKFTSDEVGQLLEDLQPLAQELDADSDDARLLKVVQRRYNKDTRVPADLVAEFTQVTTVAHTVWEKARAESKFSDFEPYLAKIVDLRRAYAGIFAPYDHVYDPLLDDYEPGMKTAEVKAIFSELRPQQVELIQAISERPQVDDSFLHQQFPEDRQWDFGVNVITRYGYDWNRGRQDKAAHPFTINFGINDVRVTTRFMEDYFGSALFSTTHECGHALYEMGIDTRLERTPLATGASMALHESQSRTYENLLARSRDFWTYFYPQLQQVFPDQFSNVGLETFYKGINRVEPSLIRVEADEATYNLHIMLRLEIEIALMEGSMDVKDLPQVWNTRMKEYLGIVPPDDGLGVLQDVHWSAGYFGYFPTYALGNLVSAQLWETINREIPDLSEQIRQGEFMGVTNWMREKIHQHGAKYEPQELVERITGERINPAPYMRYLKTKYSDVYGI